MNSYTFSVSEVFADGRVLVFTYARIGKAASVLMQVFQQGLTNPMTLMNLTIPAA